MKVASRAKRRAVLNALCGAAALLLAASCSRSAKPVTVLAPDRVASVVVGRSTRADVFAVLGKPTRSERSAAGEAWVYKTKESKSGSNALLGGAAAGSAILGTFVPYAGLVGSGIGLANAAEAGSEPPPESASLTVAFGPDGVVHDCIYATTAAPALANQEARPIDCRRPPA